VAINALYRTLEAGGEVTDITRGVYVSPLKALAVDIAENPGRPLAEIGPWPPSWGSSRRSRTAVGSRPESLVSGHPRVGGTGSVPCPRDDGELAAGPR
jgi:hypothetical protein